MCCCGGPALSPLTCMQAVDIGSFMTTFEDYCKPKPGSPLSKTLNSAREAYTKDLFTVSRTGPGTKPGTGMAMMWPTKELWANQEGQMQNIAEELRAGSGYKLPDLLDAFYAAEKPATNGDNCSGGNPGTGETSTGGTGETSTGGTGETSTGGTAETATGGESDTSEGTPSPDTSEGTPPPEN